VPTVAAAGQRAAAYQLLAKVCGWFKGFDTADLQEVKMLLDKLA
jgi:hypothetical protein